MRREEVMEIFLRKKSKLLFRYQRSEYPVAILLGGQGAVGKSQLNRHIRMEYGTGKFLEINGDKYRCYHPEHEDLIRNNPDYSAETQVFSNVFTEGLIEEAAKRRISFVVEGTMRSPDTVSYTAKQLTRLGYSVKAYLIAAPKEYSTIAAVARYQKELDEQGFGRLIDFQSHDAAVAGILNTADRLYNDCLVHEIRIYDMFANHLRAEYMRFNYTWDNRTTPSEAIEAMRKEQLDDKAALDWFIEQGSEAKGKTAGYLNGILDEAIQSLMELRKSHEESERWHFHR